MNFIKIILALLYILIYFEESVGITLQQDGGFDIVIAFHPNLKYSNKSVEMIQNLKELWKMTSDTLYIATRKKFFFKNIKILIPKSWPIQHTEDAATYPEARIIVNIRNKAIQFMEEPYTLHHGKCGEEGEYLHIPDTLLSLFQTYEPRHKENFARMTMISWAQLRWGVFPEYPTENFPKFYYDHSILTPNSCNIYITGEVWDPEDKNNTCDRDTNGYPPSSCIFEPDQNQSSYINSSIMRFPKHKQMTTFCDEGHNKLAPNEQNTFCNQRSTWDVISSSTDVRNYRFSGIVDVDQYPLFKIVKTYARKLHIVLAIDVSGSMGSTLASGGNRLDAVKKMLHSFIEKLCPTGSFLAAMGFTDSSKIWFYPTEIKSNAVRTSLLNIIKSKTPGGSTNIEQAIRKSSEMLRGVPKDANIIVLSDGAADWTKSVDAIVLQRKQKVHVIYFGLQQGNNGLTELSDKSNGCWYFANNYKLLDQQMYSLFHEHGCGMDLEEVETKIRVTSMAVPLPRNSDSVKVRTIVDDAAAKHPIFEYAYTVPPDIVLYEENSSDAYCFGSPKVPPGYTCDNQAVVVVNSHFRKVIFELKSDRARVMQSLIFRNSRVTYDSEVTLSVTTSPNADISQIEVKSGVKLINYPHISSPYNRLIPHIWARLSRDYEPILNAIEVKAYLTDGLTGTKVILYDNGVEPDTKKDDGVYSAYYMDAKQPSRFSVTVEITGPEFTPTGSPTGWRWKRSETDKIPTFERVSYAGSFEYKGKNENPNHDLSPPAKITDFSVSLLNNSDFSEGFRFEFTAVGDDITSGTAQSYEVRYALGNIPKLRSNFTAFPEVPSSLLTSPQISTTMENMVVNFNMSGKINETFDVIRVAFAIRAIDDEGKMGEVSNLAQVDVFIVSPKILYQRDVKIRRLKTKIVTTTKPSRQLKTVTQPTTTDNNIPPTTTTENSISPAPASEDRNKDAPPKDNAEKGEGPDAVVISVAIYSAIYVLWL